MKELKLDAKVENLNRVLEFMDDILDELGCSMKVKIQMDVAVEEIFVNIAHYAYGTEGGGWAHLLFDEIEDGIKITFIDGGTPYNPLEKPDPDISLGADERQIGGLGIFMVKKSMDDTSYEYRDECNRFTIVKHWA